MTLGSELTIIIINLIIIGIAMFLVYPVCAKNDLNKLLINDLAASMVAVGVSASVFMNEGLTFNLILLDVNWFWFCLITYLLIETPIMLIYLKRQGLIKNP